MRARSIALALLVLVWLAACQSVPKDAFRLSEASLEQRQLQTRTFEGANEETVLSAAAGVIQDLGYTIGESETKLGLITAEKVADATNALQVTGALLLALLGGSPTSIDDEQHIRFSLVVVPNSRLQEAFDVRITIQRVIYNTQGQITRSETIDNSQVYEEFFDKLNKSVFLEQNQ